MITGGWDRRTQKKKKLYALVVLCAIGICFLGIQLNMRQKQQRKITYAKIAMKQEAQKIKEFSMAVHSFYKADQPEFLIDTLELSTVSKTEQQVVAVKITPSEYHLSQKEFPEDKELEKSKKLLLDKIEEVKIKHTILQSVTALIIHLPTEWPSNPEAIVIKEGAALSSVRLLQQSIAGKEDLWTQAVTAVLNTIELQIVQYETSKQQIEEMLAADGLTDKATSEAVAANYAQLSFIKNEQLYAELLEKLVLIEERLLENQRGIETDPSAEEIDISAA